MKDGKWEVMRITPLPTAPSAGRLVVSEVVATQTEKELCQFEGKDGPHEGLVLWLGRRCQKDTLISAMVVPDSRHSLGRVEIDRHAVGRTSRAARAVGLSVLVQVHSHPGWDTRHSSGDDDMVLMPFEGGYSLVVGRYGQDGIAPSPRLGLHQFQDGRWVLVRPVAPAFIVVPTLLR